MSRNAYASLPDVNSLLSFVPTFTASTRPSATQVHQFLQMASDDLDGALALGDYITPVTATAALDALRSWTSVGAAWYTAAAMPQGKDSLHVDLYRQRFTAILNQARNDELEILGADRDSLLTAALYGSGGRYDGAATPTFTRGFHDA